METMTYSIRRYAKHRGCDEKAVRKALAAGRITRKADGTINPIIADAQWAANTQVTSAMLQPQIHSNAAICKAVRLGQASFDGFDGEAKTYYKAGVSYDDVLLEGPERLAQLVQAVEEIAAFAPWLNWAAKQLWDDFWVLAQEEMQISSVEDLHLLLAGSVIQYVRETGQIKPEQVSRAYQILCQR